VSWRATGRRHRGARDSLADELSRALAPERVHTGAGSKTVYARDASVFTDGRVGIVCFPESPAEVQACVRAARRHGRSFVARGAGTGLTGGAVPCGEPVVIVTTRMDRILEVDVDERFAWVEPGVVNLDLSRHLVETGLHFAPDPSSQQSCTIGGNIANNAGGPHCLAYGVTSEHVLALEVVLPSGELVVLGGPESEPVGLDLRGAFVGGEGTLGIATKIAVRLTPDPPAIQTMLLAFDRVSDCAALVGSVIAAGIVPAAMEMMDQRVVEVVEPYVHAGYPTDAAAVLIVELDGLPGGVAVESAVVEQLAAQHDARPVRIAETPEERALIWKGRKTAFGAIARVKPNYYLHDTVIPRTKLVEVLATVYETADRHGLLVMNVFHAGDGNLHPLLVFDGREPGVLERVHQAGAEIVRASIAAGGSLSGEHGIGIEKRQFMDLMFTANDLEAQGRLRAVFDPDQVANPGKVLPTGASCADVQAIRSLPYGAWV
jgi:glycolate oxidase